MINLVFKLPISLQQSTHILRQDTHFWTKDGRWKHHRGSPWDLCYRLDIPGLDILPPSASQKHPQKLISVYFRIFAGHHLHLRLWLQCKMLSFQQNSQKPPGKPLLPCNSHPGFCLTGWWATAQQPGWLHWGGHYASRAGGGHQEVVEG